MLVASYGPRAVGIGGGRTQSAQGGFMKGDGGVGVGGAGEDQSGGVGDAVGGA